MKIVFLSFVFCLSLFAQVQINILNSCDGSVKHKFHTSYPEENLGLQTIVALDSLKIEYRGNENSIVSIEDSPSGMGAIKIYETQQGQYMQFYGWCYKVNGVGPELMPNQFLLNQNEKYKIEWYFGYASSLNGQWITQCTPAWIQPSYASNVFCSKE